MMPKENQLTNTKSRSKNSFENSITIRDQVFMIGDVRRLVESGGGNLGLKSKWDTDVGVFGEVCFQYSLNTDATEPRMVFTCIWPSIQLFPSVLMSPDSYLSVSKEGVISHCRFDVKSFRVNTVSSKYADVKFLLNSRSQPRALGY